MGGRKYLIVGIGPLGCTPSQRLRNSLENCYDEANNLATIYNKALQSMLQKLKSNFKENFKYSYLNIYDFLIDSIQNPTTYGMITIIHFSIFIFFLKKIVSTNLDKCHIRHIYEDVLFVGISFDT